MGSDARIGYIIMVVTSLNDVHRNAQIHVFGPLGGWWWKFRGQVMKRRSY